MQIVDTFPNPVRHIEHAWIPMPDGTRLAARIWLPADAEDNPVPAILEYIPYRKRDGVRLRDETMHPWFAGHGYAGVRVDIRGSGDSEGVLTDEYLQQELDDGVAIIEWLAEQPWCSGRVGMIGISWGGFNGLQIAALQPAALKAVVSVCSTDDRYADDVHYMGGCLLGDNLSWASTMFAYNSLPPDPEIVGERWRELWFQRLEGSGLWLDTWLTHQHRDEYWRHGSICEDFSKVQTPVMAVSGWADGYSNAVFRLLANLPGPRQGLIGPWSHKYPHLGVPGPAIGFLQECLRWWDHWLKDRDTGIMDEPMLRAWMLESMPPSTFYHQRYGRWVSEPAWPSPNITTRTYKLAEYRLVDENTEVPERELRLQSPLSNGLFAGKWCSYSATPDLPHDQREEDGGALLFTTEPFEEGFEILGAPVLDLELSASRPVAMIAVRLSDMRPDNKVARVTYGMLNLTHRDSHADPSPLEPGKRYRVQVQLNDVAQRFPRGHRIRLAISTSYFPLAWPPPESTQVRIYTGTCCLRLPVRPPRDESISFPEAQAAASGPMQQLRPGHQDWRVIRELDQDVSTLEVINDAGSYRLQDIDLVVTRKTEEWYSYQGDDFHSPRGETLWVRGLKRGDWSVETVTRTVLRADAGFFYLDAELDAYEGDRRVYSQNWNRRVRRQLV
ncbi:CocE/NonD family hydrolase [Thiohalobacter thiocyanaticus]|uniref:CocE/NonD family hydrolase n=1 Tax=Thiohalobacter thiocyanaticus TaxID=585455 RepID=A0A426QJZ5_9GAMM|nr:CocE/NonD family hydrolase [Thiohalobacter thiocyanaticus]RRQ22036.1 CocE/NonD family hydrolase [Thiohalobacter thiocyanaticus]